MQNFPAEFLGHFCPDGYAITSGIATEFGAVPNDYVVQRTQSLDSYAAPQTSLFSFAVAHAEPTAAVIVTLATRFGLLAEPCQVQFVSDEGTLTTSAGEPLSRWLDTMTALRHATRTWQMSFADNWETWDRFFYEPGRRQPPSREGDRKDLLALTTGSRELATELVAAALAPYALGIGFAKPDLHAVWRAPNLTAYLWLELGLAIASGSAPVACDSCQEWYLVSAQQNRSDKRYCSDACRMRAYRARKGAKTRRPPR